MPQKARSWISEDQALRPMWRGKRKHTYEFPFLLLILDLKKWRGLIFKHGYLYFPMQGGTKDSHSLSCSHKQASENFFMGISKFLLGQAHLFQHFQPCSPLSILESSKHGWTLPPSKFAHSYRRPQDITLFDEKHATACSRKKITLFDQFANRSGLPCNSCPTRLDQISDMFVARRDNTSQGLV